MRTRSCANRNVDSIKVDDASLGTRVNHWLRLSDEMVLFVLRLLPKKDLVTVSMINKKFRDLSRDVSLWTELTLNHQNIKQNPNSCRKLLERCKKLTSIKITNSIHESLNIMTVVIRSVKSLTSLDVFDSCQKWTPAALTKLGQMKQLTSLEMSLDARFGYQGLQELGKLSQLEKITLRVALANEDSRKVLANVFKQLKNLKAVNVYPGNNQMVVALAKNNPNLKVLRIRLDYQATISEESIQVLGDSCPELEALSTSIKIRSLKKLASSCHKLKSLDIEWFGKKIVSDTTLMRFLDFKSLESLRLRLCTKVTDQGVESLVNSAESLKYLRLYHAPGVTRGLVRRLREEYPQIDVRIGSPAARGLVEA